MCQCQWGPVSNAQSILDVRDRDGGDLMWGCMGGLAWLDDGAWILEATEVCVLPCCQLDVNGLDGDCGLDV